MKIEFRTNIDCCKRWVSMFSTVADSKINPNVGDQIRIYSKPTFEVWLQVVDRKWVMQLDQHSDLYALLVVDLHLQEGWTIRELEAVINGKHRSE